MKFKLILAAAFATCALPAALAQELSKAPKPTMIMPDLVVRQYQFAPSNNKVVRVQIYNVGKKDAGPSTLRLTVRKINGLTVARTIEGPIVGVPAAQGVWTSIDTTSITPTSVSLKDTTFRIDLDVTNAVAELKENNNQKWHNLNP